VSEAIARERRVDRGLNAPIGVPLAPIRSPRLESALTIQSRHGETEASADGRERVQFRFRRDVDTNSDWLLWQVLIDAGCG
jgi:hypothetical protein